LATQPSTVGTTVKRAGAGFVKWVLIVVLAAGLLYAAYTWFALSWNYSTGERAGVVQKFSNRGWVCKTYEGDLAMYVVAGVQPEIWPFTVRDEAVAAELSRSVGHRVQLHYSEHPPFHRCFGDTRYFVDRVTWLDQPVPSVAPIGDAPLGAAPVPTAPPPAAPQ
jgi:hypothetical protein